MTSRTHTDSPLSDSDARLGGYVIHALRLSKTPMSAQQLYDRIRKSWAETDGSIRRLTFGGFEKALDRASGFVYSKDGQGNYAIPEQTQAMMTRRGL